MFSELITKGVWTATSLPEVVKPHVKKCMLSKQILQKTSYAFLVNLLQSGLLLLGLAKSIY